MTKDEALKLALEAFDSMIGRKPERVEQAITPSKKPWHRRKSLWRGNSFTLILANHKLLLMLK